MVEFNLLTIDSHRYLVPYSKNIGGEKTLANYSISPSFLPIFTNSITFPMQMDFNSPNFLQSLFAKLLYCQSFFTVLYNYNYIQHVKTDFLIWYN